MGKFEDLIQENARLLQRAEDAEQALQAFSRGEVDAVTLAASATPVLLRAAQKQLRGSQQLLRSIFDGALEAMLLVDDRGRCVDANVAACNLYQLSSEQLHGRELAELSASSPAQQRIAGQSRGLLDLKSSDGTTRRLEYSTVYNVTPGLNLWVLRDISDRLAAEETVRESLDRLEEAQAIAHVGSWISGIEPDQPITWSRECYRIFGIPDGTPMTVASFFDCVHPDDREKVAVVSRNASEHGAPYALEHRILRTDGETRWVHEQAVIERDDAGQAVRFIGTVQDITSERQSRELFENFFDLSLDMLAIAGTDGYFKLVNPSFERILGYPMEEFLARPYLEFVHPEDHSITAQETANLSRGMSTYDLENRYLAKDGTYRVLSWTARPSPEGDIQFAIAHDVTERKQREKEFEQLARSLATTLNSITDPFFTLDHQLCFSYVNSGAERLLGYSQEQLLGTRLGDIFTSEEAFDHALQRAVQEDQKVQLLDHFWEPLKIWLVISFYPFQDGVSVSFHDVSERVLADQERLQAQLRVQEQAALLDRAQDAIIVRTLEEGRVTYWNAGAQRLFGWTSAQAQRAEFGGQLFHQSGQQEQRMAHVLERGEWTGELVTLAQDGRKITVESRWTLIRDDQGKPLSILTIDTDITEKKQLQAQYLRAQRMESIGTLAGGIAHDLNNMLTPILMGLELLHPSLNDPEDQLILETIQKSAEHGAAMVRQVLSFARGVEGDQMMLQLSHILSDIHTMIRETFDRNILIEVKVEPNLPCVLGDATQLHQVFLNLCVNARDAMPGGGNLSICASEVVLDEHYTAMNPSIKSGRYVKVKVSDNGTGIPESDREKIFDPFFTTKEVGKGTGLGLSTVSAIVKNHQGQINVYSEPGRGTCFTLYLPAIMDQATSLEAVQEPVSSLRGNNQLVLVVDDEPSIRAITQRTLETFGYRVVTAEDGAHAISVFAQRSHEIALVLTDIMMPVLDGISTAQALRRIHPEVRVIAASGLEYPDSKARAAAVGVSHFLSKPYTAETLLRAIQDSLTDV